MEWRNRYPKSDSRVPGISRKMGWRQVEKELSLFFHQIFAIFDDFSKWSRTKKVLRNFEKSTNMAAIWQKMKQKALLNLLSTHFSADNREPENQISGTCSTTPYTQGSTLVSMDFKTRLKSCNRVSGTRSDHH